MTGADQFHRPLSWDTPRATTMCDFRSANGCVCGRVAAVRIDGIYMCAVHAWPGEATKGKK